MAEYIEKQAAIEAVMIAIDEGYSWFDALEDIPPEAVSPVGKGQWKPFDLTFGRSIYACTSCGEASEVPTEMGTPMYRYCPNCGAKMEEEEEWQIEK